MASYNTGVTGSLTNVAHTTAFTLTVPAGVATGDVMIVSVEVFTQNGSSNSFGTPTSGGGSWTQIGTTLTATYTGGGTFPCYGMAFYRVATASDPGSTFSMSYTGTTPSPDGLWWAVDLEAYTGFYTAAPIGNVATTTGVNSTTITAPSTTTTAAGSWEVDTCPVSISASSTYSSEPLTSRHTVNTQGINSAVSDSGAGVGVTGTAIGGGSWVLQATPNNSGMAFTIELRTAAPGSATAQTTPPPIIPPHPHFTRVLLEEAWTRTDWQAQGVADLTVAFSSTSGGIDTYNVTSPWNVDLFGSQTEQMRVLAPTAPNQNYPHAFLIMLPVDTNQGTGFGDSIGTAQTLGAHNTYNLTIVQPGYALHGGVNNSGCWFGDNPLNPGISEEKYTLLVTAWIQKNLATTGQEKVYLIGFSRSGLAAQFLQFRHPYLFSAAASWDSCWMMTDYDGTDPFGAVGGHPETVFGTDVSFQTNYELTAAHLAAWQATGQYGVNRIWIGQGPDFTSEAGAYDAALTTAGIPHTYTFSNTGETHAWHTDWVAAALASIIPSNYAQATTVLPQQYAGHPLFTRLLEVAAYRAASVPGAASPLPPPLDSAWQAGALYSHLYTDSPARDRRAYFAQRAYVSDPLLLTTAELENELLGGAGTAMRYDAPAWTRPPSWPQQRAYVSDPLLLTTAELENELLGGAETPKYYRVPATHYDRREVPQQRAYVSDPLLLTTAELENELLGGAQTPRTYNTPATHYARWWMPQQPARLADPLLIATALLENELLGGAETWLHYITSAWIDRREVPQQRAYVSDPSFYPPQNNLDPLLTGQDYLDGHQHQAATHYDRREVPQQRLYISDPSFYPTVAPTDPLTVAWGAGGVYWHLYNQPASITDRREVPQQRAYVSDPLLLTTALLENELLGGAETPKYYRVAATHAPRWWMPQQPARLTDPLLIQTAELENVLLGSGDTARHWLAAAYWDRRLVPQQRPYVSDPLLLTTAELENELLGGADTGRHYAWFTDRREVPQQRPYISDPLLLSPPLPLDPTLAAWASLQVVYLTPVLLASRREYPQQRAYVSDPSFYPHAASIVVFTVTGTRQPWQATGARQLWQVTAARQLWQVPGARN